MGKDKETSLTEEFKMLFDKMSKPTINRGKMAEAEVKYQRSLKEKGKKDRSWGN